jgi:hypothetical protein
MFLRAGQPLGDTLGMVNELAQQELNLHHVTHRVVGNEVVAKSAASSAIS